MGKQVGHHQDHHQHQKHDSNHQHQHHATDPFTHKEKVLIDMAHRTQKFQAHHHHHAHHDHVQYRRPFNITTDLGLFALKKLHAMNPQILKEKDKRLLNPSAPGVLTHISYGVILLLTPTFAFSVWRNFGFKGFLKPKAALTLGVLVGSNFAFQHIASYLRELTFELPRARMVNHYKNLYGESFLIDILDPKFRLPEEFANK